MTTVADIVALVEELAPREMKEEWDHVGLLVGNRSQTVSKALVALDPFMDVCQEAADWGAELILTHHPLIFRPVRAVTTDNAVGRAILFLAQHGISAVNAHTNLDNAPGGVNDALAARLGLGFSEVLSPAGMDRVGRPWGLLRMGKVPRQSLEDFLGTVKNQLGCPGLRYVNSGRPVHHVAVGGGSCASELETVFYAGCDTFVTADVKYNQFWDARELGLNLIDAGHFYTENPICPVLADHLRAAFPDVTVRVSEIHRDCMNFG